MNDLIFYVPIFFFFIAEKIPRESGSLSVGAIIGIAIPAVFIFLFAVYTCRSFLKKRGVMYELCCVGKRKEECKSTCEYSFFVSHFMN